MNANAQASQVSDEDEPAVASRLVCVVFPLEHQPKDDSREEATVSVNLAFDRAKPEGVAEGVDQSSSQCTRLNHNELSKILYLPVHSNQLSCQMTDGPEEEHDACGTEEGTHHVDHERDFRRVAHKLSEQIGSQHEERCPRWVTDFKLVACRYELGAVPETCGRFDCTAIDESSDGERNPPHQVVDKSEMLHFASLYI